MKFSVRDLLLGTIIVALALGWWLDRTRLAAVPPPQPPAEEPRYELIVTGKDNHKPFLFDPRSGAMWERGSNAKWSPYTDGRRK
jgi:hypothetical protein